MHHYLQESSYQYWPAAVGQVTKFKEHTVDMTSEDVLEGYIIRTFRVLYVKVAMVVELWRIAI